MKKSTRLPRLTLNKETLGILTNLTGVAGGSDTIATDQPKSMSMCNTACCPPTYTCPFFC